MIDMMMYIDDDVQRYGITHVYIATAARYCRRCARHCHVTQDP
jgi:hypothetical protein